MKLAHHLVLHCKDKLSYILGQQDKSFPIRFLILELFCFAMMLTTKKRGVITHRARAKQIIDFSGLRFGNITPTDIDGLIEYHDKCFLFVELKHSNKNRCDLDVGQRLALERLCNSLNKPALLLHAIHSEPVQNDIQAGACYVYQYFWKREWILTKHFITVKEAAEGFFKKFG